MHPEIGSKEDQRGYAKINLTLDVKAAREDGFHEVSMIMQQIRLWDDLYLEITEGEKVTFESNIPFLGASENNIAYRAVVLMRERFGLTGGLAVRLNKRIPIAAGLAGGSADTAAVLRGMNRLYQLNLSRGQLMKIGAEVGSDIPYCIMGGTCRATGRGEWVQRLKVSMPFAYVVLVKPPFGISTPWSYRMFDHQIITKRPDEKAMEEAMASGNLKAVGAQMVNLLEPAALSKYPVLEVIQQDLKDLGADGAMMSGSGPTVYGLFARKDMASNALYLLRRKYPQRYQVMYSQILERTS